MKKVLLAVAVVAFFASCKKDYTCTCVDTTDTDAVTTEYPFTDVKKSEADDLETTCETGNTSYYTCTWSED